MPYPTGVVLRTLTSGDSSALAGGMPLITELRVRPSRGLTYDGHPMPAHEEVVRSALGEQSSIELPVCDQSGHRDALTGAIIDVSAEGAVTHTYRVLIRWLTDGDREVSRRIIAELALPTEDLSPVDADVLVDVPTVAGTVVSVPDSWSAQIEAIAASIPAEVEDYLTANPPSGSPDATALTKGIVRLAGDLAGTAGAPTVPGLADKADTDHTHVLADITDYTAPPPPPDLSGYATTSAVASALAGKADTGHGHAIGDVSGLQPALDGKQAAGSYAPTAHAHDDRYYTEAETDTLLAGKAATGHTHGELHTHANAAALALVSGTNTGDQTLPTWSTIAGKPAVIAQGATAAAARTAIGAGTSSFSGAYADLTGKPTLGTAAATSSTDYATAAQGAKADTALQPAAGQPINAQTGTAYTLAAADAGKLVTLTNAAAITLTVPGNVFTAGQRVDVLVLGAGMVTAVGSSCTVNGTPSLVSRAQYSAFTVLFTSATTAVVVGDLASA